MRSKTQKLISFLAAVAILLSVVTVSRSAPQVNAATETVPAYGNTAFSQPTPTPKPAIRPTPKPNPTNTPRPTNKPGLTSTPTPQPPAPTPAPHAPVINSLRVKNARITVGENAVPGFETIVYNDKDDWEAYPLAGKVEFLWGVDSVVNVAVFSYNDNGFIFSRDYPMAAKGVKRVGSYFSYDLEATEIVPSKFDSGAYRVYVTAVSGIGQKTSLELFFYVMHQSALEFVSDLYTQFMGWPSVPPILYYEYAYRLSRRSISATTLLAEHLLSQSFLDRAEYLSAENFVASLYRTVLQREPDDAGMRYWLGYMNYHSRLQVEQGFLDSQEFKNYCENHGWVW